MRASRFAAVSALVVLFTVQLPEFARGIDVASAFRSVAEQGGRLSLSDGRGFTFAQPIDTSGRLLENAADVLTPEPATLALFASGLLFAAGAIHRRPRF